MLPWMGNCIRTSLAGGAEVTKPVSIEFGDLVEALFLERPNRFLVVCRLQETGKEVLAHLADPGRLKELLLPGAKLFLRFAHHPRRKTKWSVVLVQTPDETTYVSLHAAMANQLTSEALQAGVIADLAHWDIERQEYTYGGSRWDFLLQRDQGLMLLEVKSCTLVQDGMAMFPDAVTARGRRHVQELTALVSKGKFAGAVLFVIQREDAAAFRPAGHIDPDFAEALKRADQHGVKLFAYNCQVRPESITWGQELRMELS